MVAVAWPEVAGSDGGEHIGGRPESGVRENGGMGHGFTRDWVCSNAHDSARRVAVVACTGVAGDEQYDVAGGGVFRASNGNGDVARYWANGRATQALLDAASSMATRP